MMSSPVRRSRVSGLPLRRSIRLKRYDYTEAGAYFITIVTQSGECLFGEVVNGIMRLNDAGRMVSCVWNELPERFPSIILDAFVVMPNHIHGIIVSASNDDAPIRIPVGAGLVPARHRATTRVAPTVGDVIGAFKSRVTVEYTRGVRTNGWMPFRGRLWQRNYYEPIIRNEESLNRIRQYILDNPQRWAIDPENLAAITPEPEYAWLM